jgi:glycosyltransferase involved in cell wall biosynthesis
MKLDDQPVAPGASHPCHAAHSSARAMGEAGLRRAYRHYTWRTVARQVADIYAAVLADARAPIAVTQPQE